MEDELSERDRVAIEVELALDRYMALKPESESAADWLDHLVHTFPEENATRAEWKRLSDAARILEMLENPDELLASADDLNAEEAAVIQIVRGISERFPPLPGENVRATIARAAGAGDPEAVAILPKL